MEHLIGWKCDKADGKKWVHGVPLSRWWGCFGVLGVGWRHIKGWRFGVHRSAVDVMRGKLASDKSFRKESEPNKGEERPSIYDASVSFDGDRPLHEKMVV